MTNKINKHKQTIAIIDMCKIRPITADFSELFCYTDGPNLLEKKGNYTTINEMKNDIACRSNIISLLPDFPKRLHCNLFDYVRTCLFVGSSL